MPPIDLFKGRKIVIATMHGKERIIAPLLEKHFGLIPITVEGLNTDIYGTFTGEIKRDGNQLEAARKKVSAAMHLAKTDLAIASEGSFGAHPSIPFVQSNLELLLFVDKKNNLEILGHCRTEDTNMNGRYVRNVEEALVFAHSVGFPEHGIIIRNSKDSKHNIHKNITTEKELAETVTTMLSSILMRQVYLETDMRAHKNPTRMKAIEQAMLDLIKNIQSLCPQCQAPGCIITDLKKGLPCSRCHLPTELPLHEVYVCAQCNHEEIRLAVSYGNVADPLYCDYCNHWFR